MFKIDGSGIGQVKSHEGSRNHVKLVIPKMQSTLTTSASGQVGHTGGAVELSHVMKVLRAEVIQALHIAQCNITFSSAESDGSRSKSGH